MRVIDYCNYSGTLLAEAGSDDEYVRAHAYHSTARQANVVSFHVHVDDESHTVFVAPHEALKFALDLIQVAREAGAGCATISTGRAS